MERKEEVKVGEAAMSLPAELMCLQGSGGTESEAAMAMLEKQLICPICLELFNKPVVILPCQHNLCRKCANDLYQARTTMMVNSGRFRCPSCRHEVVLDRHGVYGLQRNLLVENIIDVYKQELNNSSNNTSPLPPPPPPAHVTCSDHEGEKVNIYCLTCQVPTCSLCKVFGAHQSCKVAPLTDVYQQKKDELSGEVQSLVAVNDKIQTLINELEEACRNIEENSKTQKQSVCDAFNHVFSILEERQKAMTLKISSEQEEKTGHIQVMVRCYGDSVEANSKLLETAGSSMEEEDMAAFVQTSQELIKKVIASTGSCPAETLKPGCETLGHYTYDFCRQETALRGIDFLKVVEDVPEEPVVEQEPEEPKEASVQSIEPEQHEESSPQDLDLDVEPVQEPIPVQISTPVEPVQTAEPTKTSVQPEPALVRDSVELEGAGLLGEGDALTEGESSQKSKMEEEEEEEEEEVEVAPILVKEENICEEEEEEMSTQQSGGGEAPAQRETEAQHGAQGEEEEEEEKEVKKEEDAMLYPSWYKPKCWPRVPKFYDPEQRVRSPHPTGDSLPVQIKSLTQISPQQPPDAENKNTSQRPPQNPENQPQPQTETTGEEEEEEEDMLGWVCFPRAEVEASVEGSRDLGEVHPSSMRPTLEERCSSDKFELHDGRLEERDEDYLDLKWASELEERSLDGDEAAVMKERLENGDVGSDESSKVQRKDLLEGTERTDSLTGGDSKGEEEDGEPEDLKDEVETAESEEIEPPSDSLQALTMLFYLLAFLVILQRVWAYVGRFICT